MTVMIDIPKNLARYTGGAATLEAQATTVGEALEEICRRHPQLRPRLLDERGALHPYLALIMGDRMLSRDNLAAAGLDAGDRIEIVALAGGGADSSRLDDVRMRGFRRRVSVEAARAIAFDNSPVGDETVASEFAGGRILAASVCSPVAIPPFDRSAMDGYAVVAADTFGASPYEPITLRVAGECLPGRSPCRAIESGECARIMTGAPLPDGADAVIKVEETEAREEGVAIHAPTTPGKNVGRRGEDVGAGDVVLEAGRHLRPQDVGLLASIGVAEVSVRCRPRVGIVVTGDELLAPGESPRGFSIVDSNTPMMRALVQRDGGLVVSETRVRDDRDSIRRALSEACADVILSVGGSSVGREDWLPDVVSELGELLVHGIAMRPSSPTGIGRIGESPVFLLPGNPVSCLCAYDFFAGPAIRARGGATTNWPYPQREVTLARRVTSMLGRTDYVRLEQISSNLVVPLAASGASVLSSTTRAHGFTIVPEDSEGFGEGESIVMYSYEPTTFGS